MTGSPAESQPEEASESEIHSDEESVALYLSVVADLYLLDGPVAGAPGKTEVVAGRHGDGIQDKDRRPDPPLRIKRLDSGVVGGIVEEAPAKTEIEPGTGESRYPQV